MQVFFGAFRNITILLFLATKEIFIIQKTLQMVDMKHVHLNRRKCMLNSLQKSKMVTLAIKTYILGSATAGHGDRLNWTSLIEFFKLSLFWPIYIETTNIQ